MKTIHNFRDFGGYSTQNGLRIRQGLLYRSGNLAHASEQDLTAIASLGIKTIFDLRIAAEIINDPDKIPVHAKIKAFNIPRQPIRESESRSIKQLLSMMFGKECKIDYLQLAKTMYQSYAIDTLDEFSTILKMIGNSDNLPILVHCTVGKDRTGVVVSIIQ